MNTKTNNYKKLSTIHRSLLSGDSNDYKTALELASQQDTPIINKLLKSCNDNLQKIQAKHHLLDITNETIVNTFKKFFITFTYVADHIEKNNDEISAQPARYAYLSVLLLFNQDQASHQLNYNIFATIDKYLKQFSSTFQKPIHDTFVLLNTLPDNSEAFLSKLNEWKKILKKHGNKVLPLISNAEKLQKKLAETNQAFNYYNLKTAELSLHYKYASDDIPLANAFKSFKVPENVFNQSLLIRKHFLKTNDFLPGIVIDGRKANISNNKNAAGYFLVKLPHDDPHANILGYITGCCQSIGGHAQECVIDGLTLPYNGFYVLLKSKKKKLTQTPSFKPIDYNQFDIVGQAYAYFTKNHNLVFDSWENNQLKANKAISVAMIKAFAKQCIDENPKINQVRIGFGGGTPQDLETETVVFQDDDPIAEGFQYGDSSTQYIIHTRPDGPTNLKIQIETKTARKTIKEILLLTASDALACYKKQTEYFPSFEQLKNIKDNEIIKALTSDSARQCYAKQPSGCFPSFEQLKNIKDNEVILALTSDSARQCYAKQPSKYLPSFEQLKNIKDYRLIEALTLNGAQQCYEKQPSKYFPSFAELKATNVNQVIYELTSESARQCYAKQPSEHIPSFKQLKNINNRELIYALTSGLMQSHYEKQPSNEPYLSLPLLINAESERVIDKLLNAVNRPGGGPIYCAPHMSGEISKFYSNLSRLTFKIDPNFNPLTSFGEFKTLEQVKAFFQLTTEKALFCHMISTQQDLNKFITALTKIHEWEYSGYRFQFDCRYGQLIEIQSILSANTELYSEIHANFPSFDSLKKITDPKLIAALTSDNAIRCYAKQPSNKYPSFDSLKKITDPKLIAALTSDNAIRCYAKQPSNKYPSFEELKNTNNSGLVEALISSDAQACYQSSSRFLPAYSDLKNIEIPEKILSLTSENARKCYDLKPRCYYPFFANLKSIEDPEKILALTSEDAIKFYELSITNPALCVNALSSCNDPYNIRALTSEEARTSYETMQTIAPDFVKALINLDNRRLTKTLLSNNALTCYLEAKESKHYPSFKTLIELYSSALKKIQSNEYQFYYPYNNLYFEAFVISYFIKALISMAAQLCYSAQTDNSNQNIPSFKELSKIPEGLVVNNLLSLNAILCYTKQPCDHYPSFEQLIGLKNGYKIDYLTSDKAIKRYENDKPNIENLFNFLKNQDSGASLGWVNNLDWVNKKIEDSFNKTPTNSCTTSAMLSEMPPPRSSEITEENLTYTIFNGVDTYVFENKPITQLAFKNPSTNKALEKILQREEMNPLVRQNTSSGQSNQGEYYITHEGIALLVHKKFYSGLETLENQSVYVIDSENSDTELGDAFSQISLISQEQAHFVFISGIHACYINVYNNNGQYQISFIDSEAGENYEEVQSAAEQAFGNKSIIASNQLRLQLDYYSCSTFALFCLDHFTQLENQALMRQWFVNENSSFGIDINKLPIQLLAMSQTPLISRKSEAHQKGEVIQAQVYQQLKTLLQENQVSINDKTFNAAALKLKRDCFNQLTQYLETLNITANSISTDPDVDLPDVLKSLIKETEIFTKATASPLCQHSCRL